MLVNLSKNSEKFCLIKGVPPKTIYYSSINRYINYQCNCSSTKVVLSGFVMLFGSTEKKSKLMDIRAALRGNLYEAQQSTSHLCSLQPGEYAEQSGCNSFNFSL